MLLCVGTASAVDDPLSAWSLELEEISSDSPPPSLFPSVLSAAKLFPAPPVAVTTISPAAFRCFCSAFSLRCSSTCRCVAWWISLSSWSRPGASGLDGDWDEDRRCLLLSADDFPDPGGDFTAWPGDFLDEAKPDDFEDLADFFSSFLVELPSSF